MTVEMRGILIETFEDQTRSAQEAASRVNDRVMQSYYNTLATHYDFIAALLKDRRRTLPDIAAVVDRVAGHFPKGSAVYHWLNESARLIEWAAESSHYDTAPSKAITDGERDEIPADDVVH